MRALRGSRAASVLARVALVLAVLATVPRAVAGAGADALFRGDEEAQDALAREVAGAVLARRDPVFYHSGSARFDGQSAIAIHQMTLLGLGQIAMAHPDRREAYLPAMRVSARALATPSLLRYADTVWGHHGITTMLPGEGHAYLGYVNLGLGALRVHEPDTPLAALHDRITERLAEALFASPNGLIETYPGESWPPDVAAVAGSIGLHAAATGRDRRTEMARWEARFAACAIDGASGMLVQRVKTGTCTPVDAPRGSGTAVAAYFTGFASRSLSEKLHRGVVRARGSVLGFGGIDEYPPGHRGSGDVNAGPIVFGMSVGASGFGLGSARMNGDRETFSLLYRSTWLLGAPRSRWGGGRSFAVGGALGNALLLAMLTARAP